MVFRSSSFDSKRICPAMKDAGVVDPDSQEGMDFCVYKCPYECCIVFEKRRGARKTRDLRIRKAVGFYADGWSFEMIAKELGVCVNTVRSYLR